jgi:Trypsin
MKHGRHSLQTLRLLVLYLLHQSTYAEYTNASATVVTVAPNEDGDIRGGTPIDALSWYGVFTQSQVVCGAALIHGDIALTAAHCLDSLPSALRFNSNRRTSGGTVVSVIEGRKHPDWNGVITSSDLGNWSPIRCLFCSFDFHYLTKRLHLSPILTNSHFSSS